jgi:hypothetical protein
MGTRAGLVIGLGVGYVLGARAGRERYNDIRRWWGRASGSPVVQQSVEKMKDAAGSGARQGLYAVQHGVEKAGSAVRERLNKENDPTAQVRQRVEGHEGQRPEQGPENPQDAFGPTM